MGMRKESLEIGGQPILEHILESLGWPGPTLLVSAPSHRHPPGWRRFFSEVSDAVEGEGPLRGVLTAIEDMTTECGVICPVDMPALGAEPLQWMADRLPARPGAHGVMLRRRVGSECRTEPFPFACRKSAAGAIAGQLASGERSLHSLLSLPGFALEDAPGHWSERVWLNLNTPEDYAAFANRLASASESGG